MSRTLQGRWKDALILRYIQYSLMKYTHIFPFPSASPSCHAHSRGADLERCADPTIHSRFTYEYSKYIFCPPPAPPLDAPHIPGVVIWKGALILRYTPDSLTNILYIYFSSFPSPPPLCHAHCRGGGVERRADAAT